MPWPHRAFRTPFVFGTVTSDGTAVAGVRVRVVMDAEDGRCDGGDTVEGVSDARGEFVLCPDPDLRLFMTPAPAHASFSWNVCVLLDGNWRVVHSGREYGLADAGPREIVPLRCDISGEAACRVEEQLFPGGCPGVFADEPG